MTKNRQYTQLWLNAIVILDVTTFPLPRDRWGNIPIPAQHFFKSYIDEYLKNETLTNRREIKENAWAILRHGVYRSQDTSDQSFINAMCDIMFHQKEVVLSIEDTSKTGMTIKEYKQYLSSVLDIDRFVHYQNGNLITSFYNSVQDEVDISKYSSSTFYNESDTFRKVVNAFENYKKFIAYRSVMIDHTYGGFYVIRTSTNCQ